MARPWTICIQRTDRVKDCRRRDAAFSFRADAARRYNGRRRPVSGSTVRNHDAVFLKHFSQVIAILVGITIALILLGMYINGLKPAGANPVAEAATLESTQAARRTYDEQQQGQRQYLSPPQRVQTTA